MPASRRCSRGLTRFLFSFSRRKPGGFIEVESVKEGSPSGSISRSNDLTTDSHRRRCKKEKRSYQLFSRMVAPLDRISSLIEVTIQQTLRGLKWSRHFLVSFVCWPLCLGRGPHLLASKLANDGVAFCKQEDNGLSRAHIIPSV